MPSWRGQTEMETEQGGQCKEETGREDSGVPPLALSCDKNGQDLLPKTMSFLFQVDRSSVLPKSSGYIYYFTAVGKQGWRELRSGPSEQLRCPWGHCLPLARWSPPSPPRAPGRLQRTCWPPHTLLRPPAPYCARLTSTALPFLFSQISRRQMAQKD